MGRDYNPRKKKGPEAVTIKPLEVKASECGNDVGKMIKKFMRKVKKEEVLLPVYERMAFKPKSQKRREKKIASTYRCKKEQAERDKS